MNDPALSPLAELPTEDQEALREIYGDQLDVVVASDDEIDDSEPQEAPCCADEPAEGDEA